MTMIYNSDVFHCQLGDDIDSVTAQFVSLRGVERASIQLRGGVVRRPDIQIAHEWAQRRAGGTQELVLQLEGVIVDDAAFSLLQMHAYDREAFAVLCDHGGDDRFHGAMHVSAFERDYTGRDPQRFRATLINAGAMVHGAL